MLSQIYSTMPFEDQCPTPLTPGNDAEIIGYIDAEFALPFLQAPAITYGSLDDIRNDAIRGGARQGDQLFVPSPLSEPFLPGDQSQIPAFQNAQHGANRAGDLPAANGSSIQINSETVTNPSLLATLQATESSADFLTEVGLTEMSSGHDVDQVLRANQVAGDSLRAAYFRNCNTPKAAHGSVFPGPSIPSSTVTQDAHCNQAAADQKEGSLLLPGAHPKISSSDAELQRQSALAPNSSQHITDGIGPPPVNRAGGTSHVLHSRKLEEITSPCIGLQDLLPECDSQRTPTSQSFNDSAISGGQTQSKIQSAAAEFCVEDFLPEHGLGVAESGVSKRKGPIPKMTKHALEQIANDFTSALGDDFPVLEEPFGLQPLTGAYRRTQVQATAKAGTVKTTRKPRAKKEKVVQPLVSSKHCHICARSGHPYNLAGCRNLHVNGCRKVVCRKCYNTLGATSTFEQVTAPADRWECIHCQGMCPEKAQCVIYAKTNARRRDINLQKKRLAASKAIRKTTPGRSSSNPCAGPARPSRPSAQ